MKTIAYILAGILIFFGVMFVWASFGDVFNSGWLVIGLITLGVGFGLIWFASQRAAQAAKDNQSVNLKIDLGGQVKLDSLKCQSCGGVLSPENIQMVAGAPVVSCPYCKTSYQLTEEPKW